MAKPFGAIAGRAIRTASGKQDSRVGMIKAVRAACRRLGLEDDDRRALQQEVTGKISLGDMDLPELGRMLDRLNKDYKGPSGNRAYLAKIRALWWTLYWLGAIHEPNDEALTAFVKRQTGKQRLQFLGHREAFSVIEALKSWAARLGVDWPGRARLEEVREHHRAVDQAQLDRHAVLSAIGAELRKRGILRTIDTTGYVERACGLSPNHWSWTPRELDAAIRELGKKLRRAIEKERAQ